MSSAQSHIILSDSSLVSILVSDINSIRYSVSLASFNEIFILAIKSALLCPLIASLILAPILVPERSICLDNINFLISSTKYLYKFTVLTANLKLLDTIVFSALEQYIVKKTQCIIRLILISILNNPLRCEPIKNQQI